MAFMVCVVFGPSSRFTITTDGVCSLTCNDMQVVYLLGAAFLHYLIHINNTHEIIKAASPMFCHIIVGGG